MRDIQAKNQYQIVTKIPSQNILEITSKSQSECWSNLLQSSQTH